MTKVCDSIGIDRGTVRKRFGRNGYKLEGGKYIATENIPISTIKKTTVATTNTSSDNVTKKDTKQTQENKQIKALESKIESLEKQIESINNILNTITTETTNNRTTKNTIKIKNGNSGSRLPLLRHILAGHGSPSSLFVSPIIRAAPAKSNTFLCQETAKIPTFSLSHLTSPSSPLLSGISGYRHLHRRRIVVLYHG